MTPDAVKWAVVEHLNGMTFRWGYCGEDLVAEWSGVLSLRATPDGEIKTLQVAPGAPDDLVEKLRHGAASAFLRARKHQHALHASAVARQGKALVCVGASGAGKSTMADRMCRYDGVALLSDDTTGVTVSSGGGLEVLPTEAVVWLVGDGPLGKAPRPRRAADRPAPLAWIVALAFDDAAPGVLLREIKGADAVAVVLPALTRFEKAPALWAREFEFVSRLVRQCRVMQATRSNEVAADDVAEALIRLMSGGTP
jgi:hypothetical protein